MPVFQNSPQMSLILLAPVIVGLIADVVVRFINGIPPYFHLEKIDLNVLAPELNDA